MTDVQTALAIVERAMGYETEGREFYLKAAQNTQDENGREMFRTLAEDEEKHYGLLKRQQASLRDEGEWLESPGTGPVKLDLKPSLFPGGKEALEKGITEKSTDRDALLFGLEIENKSYYLYWSSADKLEDPRGRQMFEYLAGQEQGHFNTLMMRYEGLFGPVAWGN